MSSISFFTIFVSYDIKTVSTFFLLQVSHYLLVSSIDLYKKVDVSRLVT
jgi:hypothetical protein